VPEGDTIHRTAAALRTALVGKPTERFDAPRLVGPRPELGRVIERVESTGKHLEIVWDDSLVLHTHMRMTGSWHLYRTGERWRKPSSQLRAAITVHDWVAVCFNAPVVETYRAFDRHRHPGFGRLGPDLCKADADLSECAQRMIDYDPQDTPIAEVLLDQRVMCGVGNVYRSEILWACGISPFAPVSSLQPDDCVQLVATGARLLRANLHHSGRITTAAAPGGLAVYGRNGQHCVRCADSVQCRRVGEHARILYWCDGCQTHLAPQRSEPVSREMDPHPAAAQYLAELPWRRHDPLAG
jgi:endonuclease-8